MSIQNAVPATAQNFNDAFVSKTDNVSKDGNLALNAALSFPKSVVSTSGTINALSSSVVNVKLTGATVVLNGATAGSNGQILIIQNSTGSAVTINSLSGSASAANQFQLTSATVEIPSNGGAFFEYDSTAAKWYQISYVPSTSSSGTSSSQNIINVGLNASVAANALTVALKVSDGSTNPSAGSPSSIAFRSSTATNGAYNERSITGALSITIPSGTTLGTKNATQEYIYVYAIDNAGTVELALSLNGFIDEAALVSTTAISGGTSRTTLYSTTARTNVPVRKLGRISSTQTTAGTWASAVSESSNVTVSKPLQRSQVRLNTNAGQGSTNTRIRRYTNVTDNYGTAITYADSATLGMSCTINEDGIYSITVGNGSQTNTTSAGISLNSSQLTTDIGSITAADRLAHGGSQIGGGGTLASGSVGLCSWTGWLTAGDVIRSHDVSYAPTTAAHSFFTITKVSG